MAKKESKGFDPREYMLKAIEVMNESVQEPREDKVSPKVGAVIILPDGTEDTAARGELRHGDHAEFTLLERKNRKNKLDGSYLFATLEPCAPGARSHPKLGCTERIVNARIKKVWIGVEDPDPSVDRKGIKYLEDNGIEVEMFEGGGWVKVLRKQNIK
jgi:ATP-dependent DNA helicase RecG